MSEKFIFHIRPLSLDEGFELDCEGVLEQPMKVPRLFAAVVTAAQIGHDLEAEIHILDTDGLVAEALPMPRLNPFHLHKVAA